MRRFIYILLFLLSLPFREGAGSVYASYFEVQVPMSSGGIYTTSSAQVKHISCGGGISVAAAGTNRSTLPFRPMQSVCNVPAVPVVRTTGRFTTTVNPLDDNGRAYAPGQVPAGNASGPQHLRRVSHDDDEDDPFMGNVVPIGETPFALFALLLLAYMTVRLRDRRKKVSF